MRMSPLYRLIIDLIRSPLIYFLASLIALAAIVVAAFRILGGEVAFEPIELLSAIVGLAISVTVLVLAYRVARMRMLEGAKWELLQTNHEWKIRDLAGTKADFRKRVKARALSDGVFYWIDRFASEGISSYDTINGKIVDIREVGNITNIRVALDQVYNKGDEIVYEATRKLEMAFISNEEWVAIEPTQDCHGSAYLVVHFPPDSSLGDVKCIEYRKGIRRTFDISDRIQKHPSSAENGPEQGVSLSVVIDRPRAGDRYEIRWQWNGGIKQAGLSHAIADLQSANLEKADLSGADLHGARLVGANLYKANLKSAVLRGADLNRARLVGAKLQEAELVGANLQGADLRDANLRGANLSGSNLHGAIVVNERLAETKSLSAATMPDGSRYDGRFKLPGDIETS